MCVGLPLGVLFPRVREGQSADGLFNGSAGAGGTVDSAGCRVKLKSPPSKIECESAYSRAGVP